MTRMKHALALFLLTAAAMTLSACGQKGPLFLPGHAPESQTEGAFGPDDDDDAQDEAGEDAEPERQVPDIHSG